MGCSCSGWPLHPALWVLLCEHWFSCHLCHLHRGVIQHTCLTHPPHTLDFTHTRQAEISIIFWHSCLTNVWCNSTKTRDVLPFLIEKSSHCNVECMALSTYYTIARYFEHTLFLINPHCFCPDNVCGNQTSLKENRPNSSERQKGSFDLAFSSKAGACFYYSKRQ